MFQGFKSQYQWKMKRIDLCKNIFCFLNTNVNQELNSCFIYWCVKLFHSLKLCKSSHCN